MTDAAKKSRSTTSPTFSLAAEWLAAGEPLVDAGGNRSLSYRFIKRTMDICGSLALLIALAPLLIGVLIVLAIQTKGHPFFVQQRVGFRGRKFPMFKFRTMSMNAEAMKHLVKNEIADGPAFKNRQDPRVTKLGRLLRRTSIDELPQLVNVLLGQMTLVGPRPLPVKEVAAFQAWHRQRLTVKPGLTCLWQVSGRSEIGFADWCRMDIWYTSHQSLLTDIKLLLATPWCVLTGKGAY